MELRLLSWRVSLHTFPVAFPPTNRIGFKTILDDPQGSVQAPHPAPILSPGTQGCFQQTVICKITHTTFTRICISLALTKPSSCPIPRSVAVIIQCPWRVDMLLLLLSALPKWIHVGTQHLIRVGGKSHPFIVTFYISALIKSKWQEMNWVGLRYSLRSLKINYWESILLICLLY